MLSYSLLKNSLSSKQNITCDSVLMTHDLSMLVYSNSRYEIKFIIPLDEVVLKMFNYNCYDIKIFCHFLLL